jgi:hypothetical protein
MSSIAKYLFRWNCLNKRNSPLHPEAWHTSRQTVNMPYKSLSWHAANISANINRQRATRKYYRDVTRANDVKELRNLLMQQGECRPSHATDQQNKPQVTCWERE